MLAASDMNQVDIALQPAAAVLPTIDTLPDGLD